MICVSVGGDKWRRPLRWLSIAGKQVRDSGLGAILEQRALCLCLDEPVEESCGCGCVVAGFTVQAGVGEIMAANAQVGQGSACPAGVLRSLDRALHERCKGSWCLLEMGFG